jgi:transposase InsO family protein
VGAARLVPPRRHNHHLHRAGLSPWENPFLESFNGRVRDQLLNVEEFATLSEAQVHTEAWRVENNTYRPHSSLGGLTPPNTPSDGPSTSQHSHTGWTTQRNPLTPPDPLPS